MEINNDDNISLDSSNSINCTICLSSLHNNNNITLQCYHTFHNDCINEWFNNEATTKLNNTCPICRTNIKSVTIIIPTYNINLPPLHNETYDIKAYCCCLCCLLCIIIPFVLVFILIR